MTQLDKNGQEVQQLVLKDVTVTPQGSYNLFSVTKRMMDAWELYGAQLHYTSIRIYSRTISYFGMCKYGRTTAEVASGILHVHILKEQTTTRLGFFGAWWGLHESRRLVKCQDHA